MTCAKKGETTATFSNGLTSVLLVIVRSKRFFFNFIRDVQRADLQQ